jgi:hypothetical protein
VAGKRPDKRFPIKLSPAQRRAVAEIAPQLADRLKLEEARPQTIDFTLAELRPLKARVSKAVPRAGRGAKQYSLQLVLDAITRAIDSHDDARRVYQFKITLLDIEPPIWRRIQVHDGSLDKLHEHIQTAMGWTNSHLHDFEIEGQNYGDPLLMEESFEEFDYRDSTTTKLREIMPKGEGLRFAYRYDFGDNWRHEVVFEGQLRPRRGQEYPVCLEGARACPPEDVGSTGGYQDFLEALADPDHERHHMYEEWIGCEPFDAEAFDPVAATKRMKQGLPDWRRMHW